jgi:hypothetical protein
MVRWARVVRGVRWARVAREVRWAKVGEVGEVEEELVREVEEVH